MGMNQHLTMVSIQGQLSARLGRVLPIELCWSKPLNMAIDPRVGPAVLSRDHTKLVFYG